MGSEDLDLWNKDFWVFDFDISKLLNKPSTYYYTHYTLEVANKSSPFQIIFFGWACLGLYRRGGITYFI